MAESDPYPGDDATVRDLVALALEYHRAARLLETQGRPRQPLSSAPFRLAAQHAIELYLTGLLRHLGIDNGDIRALSHALAPRAAAAAAHGLILRKKTVDHLQALDAGREYLVSRYGPRQIDRASQLNRLKATLDEVAEKSVALMVRSPASPRKAAKAA